MNLTIKPKLLSKSDKNIPDVDKDQWRSDVLRMFDETNQLTEKTLREGRIARQRLEKENHEVKKVANKWNEYSERYTQAVRRLEVRVIEDEKKHFSS